MTNRTDDERDRRIDDADSAEIEARMKYSKTPWEIKLNGTKQDKAAILACGFYNEMKGDDVAIITYDMDIPNAKHIVKCVNNFDALVEFVENVRKVNAVSYDHNINNEYECSYCRGSAGFKSHITHRKDCKGILEQQAQQLLTKIEAE